MEKHGMKYWSKLSGYFFFWITVEDSVFFQEGKQLFLPTKWLPASSGRFRVELVAGYLHLGEKVN